MVRHKNAHEMDIRRDTPETDSELSAQSLCHFPLQPRLSHHRKFIFRPHTAMRILNYRTSNFDRAISVFSVTRRCMGPEQNSSGDTTVSPKFYEDLWPLDAEVSSVVRIVCLPSPHHR
jgi:hypothetical protein